MLTLTLTLLHIIIDSVQPNIKELAKMYLDKKLEENAHMVITVKLESSKEKK